MQTSLIFLVSILFECIALSVLSFRIHKLRTTAGLSTFWSAFSSLSAFFSLFSKENSLLFTLLSIVKLSLSGLILFFQLVKFPLSHTKYKETKLSIAYSVILILAFICVLLGYASVRELSLFFDAFAIAVQSQMVRSSQRITVTSWVCAIFITFGQFIRFAAGLILSFQIGDLQMWFSFIGSMISLLFGIDYLFFYSSVFSKNNEPGLPL